MGSYGRNIEFRKPPRVEHRDGRYYTPTAIAMGVPVKEDIATGFNSLGLQAVALATGAQAPALSGCGLAIYEYAPAAFAGDDPNLVLFSDKDTIPANGAIQLIHGVGVKVVLTNTDNASNPDFVASYHSGPRVMVAGLGATPTVVVGDYLTPGTGDNTSGYWAEVGAGANAWLRVTNVDLTRHEVEAEFLF